MDSITVKCADGKESELVAIYDIGEIVMACTKARALTMSKDVLERFLVGFPQSDIMSRSPMKFPQE